ncbi:MAG: selenium metabolism-associated LysR family transcriptional regulator [Thermodesulfovibrio sp.]|uniref:selenium metabolism-associated LysR family transcriptional regulator n=1 Tax=unclassified Thermodesulfovibrio TaxID=2645936 RepID=UPI00083A0671|nr:MULTISPECIES: selenium metabolism-associated LysR family transcriptional regulator [unclassified Thermodesulfovibrio]MDI1472441.1 selenium metabolism-associated LysR family transcriptional regulator [Thermodesulfovibrio sp. 1176]MDI6714521.1 selenium metabolism-associated LysR family transcriptional regulator [Thermodesulfovibrio sp.]
MDIHHLKIFVSVYKNKSFSKAANQNFLTQPTVSEHIKNLETYLNCKLFDRVGKKIIPTKEADILYEHALEIIDKLQNLKENIEKIKKIPSGKILIGASTIPGTYILPSFIASFKKFYPDINIQINISDSQNVINSIFSGDILLGFVGTKINNSLIDYIPFVEDELVVASPNFFDKSFIDVTELLEYPFIVREEGSGTRKETEKWLNHLGIKLENLNIVCTLGSTDAVKQAIKKGIGISILSIHAIKDEIECGKLKALRIKGNEIKRTFYIAKHQKRTLPFIYQLFYKFLKEQSFTE